MSFNKTVSFVAENFIFILCVIALSYFVFIHNASNKINARTKNKTMPNEFLNRKQLIMIALTTSKIFLLILKMSYLYFIQPWMVYVRRKCSPRKMFIKFKCTHLRIQMRTFAKSNEYSNANHSNANMTNVSPTFSIKWKN